MAVTEKVKLLRRRAAAAAATLLGGVSGAHAGKGSMPPQVAPEGAVPVSDPGHWTWDTSFMQYSESQRISVSEPQVGVRRDFGDDRALTILATVDTISGATPLGTLPATISATPNTVTNASGRAIDPTIGKVPTENMSDTRVALNSTYERPLSSNKTSLIGATISKEHDFLSLGASMLVNQDFNQKNTTLSLGLSPEFDRVSPNGGLPFAYAERLAPGEFNGTSDTKYLVGGIIGLTQVISKVTVMQLNYAPAYENGYLTDPYKLLSLVDAGGNPVNTIHENRPGSRMEHSFYWLTRHTMFGQDVFSLSLRYYLDSWGIHSQTMDFTYRWQYHERRYLQPHVRYYHQSQADFFTIGLKNGWGIPDFASADYRLSSFDAVTFGVQFGWALPNSSELTLRAEYYTQTGDQRPSTAVGAQRAYDLFPTLNASILQIAYTFDPAKLFPKKNSQ